MTPNYGLLDLRDAIPNADKRVPAVSEWSVGMHIHHCALATIGIVRALAASTPPPPASKVPVARRLVFLSGRIPRGRGRSPDAVLPRADVSTAELNEQVEKAEEMLSRVDALDPKTWFKHFAFGVLDRDQTLKFIRIHNRHHLRIIADIVSA